ncbi:DUF4118 domain-containing protein [Methylibium rhizosphaerae]|uniref:DUF4118 domain-containing protein n=1 Tax=Methylibium rhizosphaerae TaxID=2570323 RepID=UPI001128B9DC|nr:DUF4118 domain-containing protein [Methylibium rhizosphaerae]
MPAIPRNAAEASKVAAQARACGRLLVWVGNNPQAELLVRHAHQLANPGDQPWTVISVETPATLRRDPEPRRHAVRALQLAESLGASTDSISAMSVLSAVVDRARQEQAAMVLIGAQPSDGWFDGSGPSWLGGLADALSQRLPGVTINVINYPADENLAPPRAQAAAMLSGRFLPQGWQLALAVVLACTGISALMEPYFERANLLLVYLAGVVYVALRFGQAASVLAVLCSILMFDWVFVPPRWSLTPMDPQYYFTFAVMLVVGLLVSRLVAQARLHSLVADARARRAQALNDLARRLVTARSEEAVGAALESSVRETFGVGSQLLLPDASGTLRDAGDSHAQVEPRHAPAEGQCDELAAAQQAFDEGVSTGAGCETAPLARALYVPLLGAETALGVLALHPLPAGANGPEERHLLNAFASQAALALERAVLERRNAAASVEAETERLRNTLLSGMSHDFRTPLTTIIGSVSSLLQQERSLDAAHRSLLLRGVLEQAQRMHALMSNLLDLTRMEEGAVQPCCEWCPADELVEGACGALSPRLQSRRVRTEVPRDAIVWCDPRLLEQALVNLLDNALCHAPAGSAIDVRVEVERGRCSLVVADDGPGIAAGQEQAVFKKFFRGRHEPAGTGTGLGLAICAAVARLHGGTIAAANAGGARFTLTLPQPAAETPTMDEAA